MMESPNSLFRERKEDYEYSDFMFRERIGECVSPNNPVFGEKNEALEISDSLIREGNGKMTTPGDVIGERKSEMEDSDMVGEKIEEIESATDVVGDREKEVENTKVLVIEKKRDTETPPVDDCCPICFGNFTIACKTNCGHWFCASCILQLWNYRATLQQCKCPICCRLICRLTPEASLLIRQEEEIIEVLKNIQRYNRLFVGGALGLSSKVIASPLVIRNTFRGLMDPDRLRFNYYALRFFALLLSLLYNISHLDFIPTGGLGIRRLFDICAIALVVILCLVGICHRWLLRRRVRLLAAAQP